MSRGEAAVLTGGITIFHTNCPSRWMYGFMLSRLKLRNPSKGAGMSSLTISPLLSSSRNLYGPHQNDVRFPLLLIFGYRHPPSLPHLKHWKVSVHL